MITLITQLKLFIQLKNVNLYFNNCGHFTNKADIFKNVLIKNKRIVKLLQKIYHHRFHALNTRYFIK